MEFPQPAGEPNWAHTGATAAWFVRTQHAAGDAPMQQQDPHFAVCFGPPAILKVRSGCVLHTIKLYQEIAAPSL